jgi:hypothetical protein
MLKPVGQLAEAVPVDCRLALARLALDDPVVGAADALVHQLVRAPDLEPPVVAVLVIDLAHGAAEVQRLGMMLSSTSAVPPGGSIMAAATSQLAMMLYCGLVLVCIR